MAEDLTRARRPRDLRRTRHAASVVREGGSVAFALSCLVVRQASDIRARRSNRPSRSRSLLIGFSFMGPRLKADCEKVVDAIKKGAAKAKTVDSAKQPMAVDRTKLLFGPYATPRFRYGKRVFCRARGWV